MSLSEPIKSISILKSTFCAYDATSSVGRSFLVTVPSTLDTVSLELSAPYGDSLVVWDATSALADTFSGDTRGIFLETVLL